MKKLAWLLAGVAAVGADADSGPRGVDAVLDLLRAQQFPDPATCSTRRLLLLQFSATTFEGIGSIVKTIVHGLAEAAHSNRTLVWGLDLPYMFEHSRQVWQVNGTSALSSASRAFDDCDWRGGGGAYGCFFERLSSCNIGEHATFAELQALEVTGHDDRSRLRLAEARRGVSAYIVPDGLAPRLREDHPRHQWAAGLAAFAFRLRERWAQVFHARAQSLGIRSPSLAMHIRHGDVHALANVYGNRRVYPFSDYFAAARRLAAETGLVPAVVFVASDSSTLDDEVAKERDQPLWQTQVVADASNVPVSSANSTQAATDAGGSVVQAVGTANHSRPAIAFVPPADRYTTPHGSHTVASDGGCIRDACALHWHDIEAYAKKNREGPRTPRWDRIMRVLRESIEDLFLLSQCDNIVTTASSHFSVLAAMLIWARTGAADPSPVFLDSALVDSGEIQTAFLHGSLNRTSSVPPHRAHERWASHQRRFMEGMNVVPQGADAAAFAAMPLGRFANVDGLPWMPDAVFRAEARRWVGNYTEPMRVWPGECPLPREAGQRDLDYISELINLGTDHDDLHPNQAVLCWSRAAQVLRAMRKRGKRVLKAASGNPLTIAELLDVAVGNIDAHAKDKTFPYSMGSDAIKRFAKLNFGVDLG